MRPNLLVLLWMGVTITAGCAGATTSPTTGPTTSPAGGGPPPVNATASALPTPPEGGGTVPPGGEVKNQARDPIALACAKEARHMEGNTGTSWYVRCPANCPTAGRVWGTDVYTDDSSLCIAAIHAGRLSASRGGVVLVTWAPGGLTYLGSERNGVVSMQYGQWRRSFFLQSVDAKGQPSSPPPALLPENTARVTCTMAANVLPHAPGNAFRIICPSGCTAGSVWGTDVYTSDSSLCKAAIHAGIISEAAGGEATITFGGGQPSFAGSERNGVKTASFKHYGGSFRLSK